jgi:hypothetical protein
MSADNPGWAAWRHNMDAALVAAFETLLWTASCNGTGHAGTDAADQCQGEDCQVNLDSIGYAADDFTPGAAREVEEDLYGFVTSCLAERPDAFAGMEPSQVGHDFILTRQRQGAGFWDRGLGERGTWLTTMAQSFGDQGAMVGDDGKVYVHG